MTAWSSQLALVGSLVLYPAQQLQAQSRVPVPRPATALSQAQTQHRAAVRAFARGDYRQAIAFFRAADEQTPSPAFSFNIAMAYEALAENTLAIAAYRDYLQRAKAAPDAAKVRAHIEALVGQAHSPPAQQLTLTTSPTGARTFLDREPVGASPVTLQVAPGKHQLTVLHDGYQFVTRDLEVADHPLKLSIALASAREHAPPSAAAWAEVDTNEAQPAADPNHHFTAHDTGPAHDSLLRTAGLVSLGASVAAFSSALTVEIMRAHTESRASHEAEQLRFAQRLETMESQQALARVFAGAGGALAALGGVLLLAATNVSSERPPAQGVAVACQPTNCRATVSGVF